MAMKWSKAFLIKMEPFIMVKIALERNRMVIETQGSRRFRYSLDYAIMGSKKRIQINAI